MNHLFVPYELSLKLKELGFDEPCFAVYDTEGFQIGNERCFNPENRNSLFPEPHTTNNPKISAPLFQQAFKWFREKHKLFASIEYSTTTQKDFVITINKKAINDARDEEYQTYEEAELACLEKLIEMVSK